MYLGEQSFKETEHNEGGEENINKSGVVCLDAICLLLV